MFVADYSDRKRCPRLHRVGIFDRQGNTRLRVEREDPEIVDISYTLTRINVR
jgi:hypothetical protein